MTHINYIILILIRNIKQITIIFAPYDTLRFIQAAASAESAKIQIGPRLLNTGERRPSFPSEPTSASHVAEIGSRKIGRNLE